MTMHKVSIDYFIGACSCEEALEVATDLIENLHTNSKLAISNVEQIEDIPPPPPSSFPVEKFVNEDDDSNP